MAGTVIENLSTKKLVGIIVGLLILEVIFILVGGLYAPQPTHVVGPAPLHHCLQDAKHPNDLVLPDTCKKVDFASTDDEDVTPDRVVFTNVVPYYKKNHMLRWFQYMLCFANMRIHYQQDNQVGKDGVPDLEMELRIAYSDHDEPFTETEFWTDFAKGREVRTLDCHFPYEHSDEFEGFEYQCEPIFIFQLGSLPHKRYLINMRLPTGLDGTDAHESNRNIGKVVDIEYIAIMQTGGFTAVWLGLKTALCIVMIGPVIWFWNRVASLERASMLIEKACFALGLSMVFLNLPVEFITIGFDAPWMLLFTDIRQGLFYAVLFSFWVIFTGEHLMDQAHRNKLSAYKWHLGCIITTSLALLGFELAERGIQLVNPFGTVWKHPGFGYALLIVGGISGALYLLLLVYLVVKVFRSISYKRRFILRDERAKRFQSIVSRLKRLMLLTLATAGLTVVFYFLEQKLDGVLNEWFALNVQVVSGFFTGVYGLWNIYVFIILAMYAPSHKLYEFNPDENSEEHEMVQQNDTEQTQILRVAQQNQRQD